MYIKDFREKTSSFVDHLKAISACIGTEIALYCQGLFLNTFKNYE